MSTQKKEKPAPVKKEVKILTPPDEETPKIEPASKKELFLPAPKEKVKVSQSHLTKSLSKKVFVISMLIIAISGLTFIFGLYYILNIQYKPESNRLLLGPVTTAPKSLRIDLDQPDDNLLVFDPSIIVSGKTAPNNKVLIFTDTKNLVINAKPDGTFSTILNLDEGVNRITTVVFDSQGDSRSAERTVFYSKEQI